MEIQIVTMQKVINENQEFSGFCVSRKNFLKKFEINNLVEYYVYSTGLISIGKDL